MNRTPVEDGRRRISIVRAWDATLDWIDDRELARPLGSAAVLLLLGVGFLFLVLATRGGSESPPAASDPAPEVEPED